MRTFLSTVTATALALVTVGCSSPPQPPSVDDSVRRPVNTPQSIDLQRCTGELSATRIALTEAAHRANRAVTGATAQAMDAARRAAENCPSFPAAPDKVGSNQVFVLPFRLGSASIELESEQAGRLAKVAAGAQLVVVRGRTDAATDSPSETALAQRRAQAAGEFLVLRAGVPRERLRMQWQGSGDQLEPGNAPTQRQRNRRVEVEVYAAAPAVEFLANRAD
ncbi:MAG: OmpA family protein [Rhodocyclales bacterium]|nr:OmpA family protein [Rhodocyclales bacterium]